jgi:hypothetical protein
MGQFTVRHETVHTTRQNLSMSYFSCNNMKNKAWKKQNNCGKFGQKFIKNNAPDFFNRIELLKREQGSEKL